MREDGRGGPLRVRVALAACVALALAPGRGAAEPPADAEPSLAVTTALAPPAPFPVIRPLLLLGVGLPDRGDFAVSVDAGLRIAPVMARWAFRIAFAGPSYVEVSTARLDWIFAEGSWAAGYVGGGAGRVLYRYESGPSASVPAYAAEAGVLFGARCWIGPLAGLHVEALDVRGRAPDPRNATLAAPRFYAGLDLNLLFVLAGGRGWSHWPCP
jgi:hypothetical protein